MANLQKYGDIQKLVEILRKSKCQNEAEVLELKSAMWALAHISTSKEGVEFLNDPVSCVYEKFIYLAKYSEIYSVRATSLNCLCLVSTTQLGATVLYKMDWISVRHDRTTFWPVYEQEDWFPKSFMTPNRHNLENVPAYNYTAFGTSGDSDINDDHYEEKINDLSSSGIEFVDSSKGEEDQGRKAIVEGTTKFHPKVKKI